MAELIGKIVPVGKVLFITESGQSKFRLGVRNIDRVIVSTTVSMNVYQMTICTNIIITVEALTALETKYAD